MTAPNTPAASTTQAPSPAPTPADHARSCESARAAAKERMRPPTHAADGTKLHWTKSLTLQLRADRERYSTWRG